VLVDNVAFEYIFAAVRFKTDVAAISCNGGIMKVVEMPFEV
jgi:hypothetical protein